MNTTPIAIVKPWGFGAAQSFDLLLYPSYNESGVFLNK